MNNEIAFYTVVGLASGKALRSHRIFAAHIALKKSAVHPAEKAAAHGISGFPFLFSFPPFFQIILIQGQPQQFIG